jgi:hypothetical protein
MERSGMGWGMRSITRAERAKGVEPEILDFEFIPEAIIPISSAREKYNFVYGMMADGRTSCA